jgi:hypothetical protein
VADNSVKEHFNQYSRCTDPELGGFLLDLKAKGLSNWSRTLKGRIIGDEIRQNPVHAEAWMPL